MRKIERKGSLLPKKSIWKIRSFKKSKKVVHHYADIAVVMLGNVLWPKSDEIREIKISGEDLP